MSEKEIIRQEATTSDMDDGTKETVGWRILRELHYFCEEQREVNSRLYQEVNHSRHKAGGLIGQPISPRS